MIKILKKYGSVFAALALTITAVNVNSACFWINNQPKLPDDAKSLRKF
ncbi:MAG: cyclic lactone autoinducer peptide [Ruminococcus sp.]|nr:cyclic lactone autoinducer peptide [Ruminococcus sp.]